ncbi:CDP-glycerol glycerophosphotransferase family protein [Neobacillus vireti]|uniref:CDP-glycerol glycerophosphotransferase family protein n=1 Tax=Neobacillus vireti TaxID=220686 RepID=UPI002FFFFDB6
MLREIAISGYLLFFNLFFFIFKIFPKRRKLCFVISFEENVVLIYRKLREIYPSLELVILHKTALSEEFKKEINASQSVPFETHGLINWLKSIYHLATARWMIIDNYYGFLSAVTFRKNVECIQIWHAAGALKTFGLQDKTIRYRSPSANRRFQKVYDHFDKIVVGSEEMAGIFEEAFNVSSQRMLKTGIPRTDFFYDENLKQEAIQTFFKQYPKLSGKKRILYAPTYRDGELDHNQLHLDVKKMQRELGDDYLLLIKLHPAVRTTNQFDELYPDFVYDFSNYGRVNELLLVADLLITDYSSLPVEYALLNKPMIFFSYDKDQYSEKRGLINDYEEQVPGPIVYDTEHLIKVIIENNFNYKKIQDFSNRWNKYSNGNASENLVKYLQQKG